MDFFELTIELEFCASHILEGHSGKCANLHGHNYRTEVCISGNKLNEMGLLVDFADIKKVVNKVIDTLDHKHINNIDYEPFKKGQTSAENVAKYVFENIETSFLTAVKVEYVRIWETAKYSVKYSKR